MALTLNSILYNATRKIAKSKNMVDRLQLAEIAGAKSKFVDVPSIIFIPSIVFPAF
jgi:hypothetical protein